MLATASANIRIVLVEPAGPLNVGSVARVMKNMGLHQLILVNPQCDYLGEEARLMAVRAASILETAIVVESLPAALVGCVRAIATTGDDCRSHPMPLEAPADALPWLLEAPSALIFGREDCGLTNAELNRAQRLIRIPSSDAYTSLNLAQAVAICCYELYLDEGRRKKEEGRGKKEEGSSATDSVADVTDRKNKEEAIFAQSPNLPLSPSPNSAPLENLEGYYQQLEGLLLKIGYLQPHTAASRMEKFRRLYNRAYPTVDEVAMLRGAIRQTEWGLKNYPRSPVSDTLDGALPENPTDS
ncbi:MAG: RNA methyltransferase [Microcoleus sp. PH2017_10_PVI_O_A]|uniref:RNA methyltransferase n=1 Tax=unclassified Microcoleus TaxID=2642155 RepID=UPI001D35100E|nr:MULTISPECIES: RNA methyltransferase [unclassified Microcoleus]TAE82494.1 MAG: RNA methyltransferase [Oscillatoriales cyanobacterium]MCC3406215.1 RNA methyltransferase [Microcoleus sp. PH2017_10_PVI_O_A]MCC3460808.1 RNA methyltransferase [Microcoleus sp. PH2017_11_PCY_U_A]MCC3479370.1 RNA methyltransferase [Microcoleus sp. PH2017_12_PCY_D_A]MCC3529160.1 RNA methyltransferase [Microcoleus sp. PH2017_21_RUC_O_A]